MVQQTIEKCVQLVTEKENLKNYQFEIEGESSKGDGYIGNIIFVNIKGQTENNNEKTLHLVIKLAAPHKTLRERVPLEECFVTEIHHYETVVSAFDDLQKEHNVKNLLDYMPSIYLSQKKKYSELLVLDNLKIQGFDVWDRKIPMSFEHVSLVLTAYGQFHAISVALKQKKPAVFEKLIDKNINMISLFVKKMNILNFFRENFENVRDETINKDCSTFQKLQFTKKDFEYAFIDGFFDDKEDCVILHGDCWNNNFLFKSNVTLAL